MISRPELADLIALSSVVAQRSFRKAADELGLSPSTLSHTIRALEAKLSVRLLNRTTRSMSPTEAGERLFLSLQPLIRDFDLALADVGNFRNRPSGTLRINASETGARLLLNKVVPLFLQRHPEMSLDSVTEGELVDIVREGFDAGVRLGEALPQDMVAVQCGGPTRFVTVASPKYLAGRKPPKAPDDLKAHDCIRIRLPSGKLYRWEFAKRGQVLAVDVKGPLILDHIGLIIEAAAGGLGIAYVPQSEAQSFVSDGRLVPLLSDWCPEIPGLFLYFPGGRLVPAGLRAFIEILREQLEASG